MPQIPKPSAVLYGDLKDFGQMSHKRAARIMLKENSFLSLDDSRISRDVVNAEPESDIGFHYRSFKAIGEDLARLLIGRYGGGNKGRAAVLDHYTSPSSPAVQLMSASLTAAGASREPYENLLERIALNELATPRQKAVFGIMLFVACGALGNPVEAAQATEAAFKETLTASIGTIQLEEGDDDLTQDGGAPRLGLLRVFNGVAKTPLYELKLPPEQTVIGALDATIMDVAPDVSRKHLAIWHDGHRWVCQGLNSMNGTTLISGADKSTQVVELPRAERGAGPSPIVPIAPGDILCLGAVTRFLVTSLQVG